MKAITSRDNTLFKSLKKLEGSAKERREAKKTLLDGEHLIEAYCETMGQPEVVILNQSSAHNDATHHFLTQWNLLTHAVVLPDALYRELSSVKSPTGILALIAIPDNEDTTPHDFCVLLEDIQDPGNLGAILRSAAAAGATHIYCSKQCADVWSPKVLRAGMGAHFCLTLHENADLLTIASQFSGLRIATHVTAAKSLFDLDLTNAVAFIIGNEGAGLSVELANMATDVVAIPMHGKIESLNAASAASVCFFERVRQLAANKSSRV